MDDELLHFIENVLINEKKDEVIIAIELKEMLKENEEITILLQIGGETKKEIIIRRRKYDNY